MARITLKQVNAALAAKGIKAELVKGNGYFWFDGDEPSSWYSSSVPVFKLNDLSLEQWLQQYDELKNDYRNANK